MGAMKEYSFWLDQVIAILKAHHYELQKGDREEMMMFFSCGETPEDTAKTFLQTEEDDTDPSEEPCFECALPMWDCRCSF